MNLAHRLVSLNGKLDRLIEFGPLGSKVNWKQPAMMESYDIPPGGAAYSTPGVARYAKMQEPRARRGGVIQESAVPSGEIMPKLVGYPNERTMRGALRRHELIHSIQSAKRSYRVHNRIRDLVSDEIGAYRTMNRGVKGGSKIMRAISGAQGVGVSTAVGIANNPRLRKRAGKYAAGALAAGGVGYAIAKSRKKNDE
jgi:hypothetical protein